MEAADGSHETVLVLARALVALPPAWGALGCAVALAFVLRDAARVDPEARGGTLGFKLLIFPACVVQCPRAPGRGSPPRLRQESSSNGRRCAPRPREGQCARLPAGQRAGESVHAAVRHLAAEALAVRGRRRRAGDLFSLSAAPATYERLP